MGYIRPYAWGRVSDVRGAHYRPDSEGVVILSALLRPYAPRSDSRFGALVVSDKMKKAGVPSIGPLPLPNRAFDPASISSEANFEALTAQFLNAPAAMHRNRAARKAMRIPTHARVQVLPPRSIVERLHDVAAFCKEQTARIAMHLDDEWRRVIFGQIDFLLNIDEWDGEDKIPSRMSYLTLLKAILFLRPKDFPSFGFSQAGTWTATWKSDDVMFFVDFLEADMLRWASAKKSEEGFGTAAGRVALIDVIPWVKASGAEHWFSL